MDCPGFRILRWGTYDSRIPYPDDPVISPRMVAYYEIEYYHTDQPNQISLNGVWYKPVAGSFLCAKPGQLRTSRLPFRCSFVHIECSDPVLCSLLNGLPVFSPLWSCQETEAVFDQLLSCDPGARLLICSHILTLLHLLNKYHLPTSPDCSQPHVALHAKTLLELESYIRNHLDQDLSLNALAQRCGLAPNYFHRLFKAAFRRTPAEFVLVWRMTAAKAMLSAGELTPTEIAQRCGFSSQNYFCYQFKKRTGMTPLEYRRASQENRTV